MTKSSSKSVGSKKPVQQDFHNPFDEKRAQGRVFTKDEVKDRMKYFDAFFGPTHAHH